MAKHKLSTLKLEPREGVGTTKSQALRAQGKIPGVVYGHGTSTAVTIEAKDLAELVHSGNRSHIVDASIGGQKDSVLLRRIETHPITRKPISVDFQRVASGEAITSSVTVVTTGTPVGVKDQGGVLDVVTHALEIRGPAQSIPDQLTVDVSALTVHQHINAGDVALPKGFTLVTAPDQIVAACSLTRAAAGEEVEATPEGEAPAAAPETPAE